MIRRLTNPHKAGSAVSDAPAVCPPGFVGSHWNAGQVTIQAKARALYAALGPCIWRTDSGGTVILSAQALRVVDISHSSAFSSGAKH